MSTQPDTAPAADEPTTTGEEIVASPAALLPIRESQMQDEIDRLRKELDESRRQQAILHAAYLELRHSQ